jgi:hypothetical protein
VEFMDKVTKSVDAGQWSFSTWISLRPLTMSQGDDSSRS